MWLKWPHHLLLMGGHCICSDVTKNMARDKIRTCVSCTSPTVNLKRCAKAIFVQKEDDQKCDFSNLPSVCLQDCHSQLLLISSQIWWKILNWIIYSVCEHYTSAIQCLAKTQVILQHFSQKHDAVSRLDRRQPSLCINKWLFPQMEKSY